MLLPKSTHICCRVAAYIGALISKFMCPDFFPFVILHTSRYEIGRCYSAPSIGSIISAQLSIFLFIACRPFPFITGFSDIAGSNSVGHPQRWVIRRHVRSTTSPKVSKARVRGRSNGIARLTIFKPSCRCYNPNYWRYDLLHI